MLVDRAARVLFANSASRRLGHSGGVLAVKTGRLQSANDSAVLEGLIASCARKVDVSNGPGGDVSIPRGHHKSCLRVTVTPLRSKGTVAELP
jgi:hypothetical protein